MNNSLDSSSSRSQGSQQTFSSTAVQANQTSSVLKTTRKKPIQSALSNIFKGFGSEKLRKALGFQKASLKTATLPLGHDQIRLAPANSSNPRASRPVQFNDQRVGSHQPPTAAQTFNRNSGTTNNQEFTVYNPFSEVRKGSNQNNSRIEQREFTVYNPFFESSERQEFTVRRPSDGFPQATTNRSAMFSTMEIDNKSARTENTEKLGPSRTSAAGEAHKQNIHANQLVSDMKKYFQEKPQILVFTPGETKITPQIIDKLNLSSADTVREWVINDDNRLVVALDKPVKHAILSNYVPGMENWHSEQQKSYLNQLKDGNVTARKVYTAGEIKNPSGSTHGKIDLVYTYRSGHFIPPKEEVHQFGKPKLEEFVKAYNRDAPLISDLVSIDEYTQRKIFG
jgi:hypothetical protein